jgi:hypothetical protein
MKLLVFIFTVLALGLWFAPAQAQSTQNSINTTLNITEYDILFLTDFINAKTQKFNTAVSGFSVDLALNPNQVLPSQIRIYMNVFVQLRGDAHPGQLLEGVSNPIPFTGRLTLTARDFVAAAGGSAVLYPRPGSSNIENSDLKKRITDFAQTTGAAPPGTYQIAVKVLPQGTTDPNNSYGGDSKTIVIPYSAVDEVFVEINDPRNGSYSNNLAPTFSWTSTDPNVTVRVYEAGLNHHSPQDALTGGNPYLEENVVGTNTLTYPANAKRQLQENKAYVLQIEANVSSSRGPMKSVSQPVVFRITNDNLGSILDYFLNSVSGNASATYSTLRADPTKWIPWSPYGNITLNGNMLSESDLQVLLKELSTQQDVKLELSVENQ